MLNAITFRRGLGDTPDLTATITSGDAEPSALPACVVGGIDPATGDTIASCGGVMNSITDAIPGSPQCMRGDTLSFQGGRWLCVPDPNYLGINLTGLGIGAAVLLGLILFTRGKR